MNSNLRVKLWAIAQLGQKIQRKLRSLLAEEGATGLVRYVWRWGQSWLWTRSRYGARSQYQAWIKAHTLTPEQRQAMGVEWQLWPDHPRISIIMPVYNVEPIWLERAIASVQAQLYPHWELCIADDASTRPELRPWLEQLPQQDERIRVVYRDRNGGISAASNDALAIATGEFVALLDNDDELSPEALYAVVRLLQSQPQADFIYSDEDKIDAAGQRFDPFFKPDWSPDYLHGCMYTCHLTVYRRALVEAVGGFRSEMDGAQDWDLALRIAAQTEQIYHIPQILYHWRIGATSMATGTMAKPWAYEAAQRSLQASLDRSDFPGTVEPFTQPGLYRVRRQIQGQPRVSIVIPSAGKVGQTAQGDRCLLVNCVASVRSRSTYPNYELIVVDGGDIAESILTDIQGKDLHVVHCAEPFNFSQRINQGVAAATGEFVVMLNDDTEVITPDWLESMLEFAQLPPVGAVGAKLLFPSGTIQHAGIIILDGTPAHAFYNGDPNSLMQYGSVQLARNYQAVTGAGLMCRRSVFDQVNGLDESFPVNYNDVDFCLRLGQRGYRHVVTPFAQLWHYESATRTTGLRPGEWEHWRDRWPGLFAPHAVDPYYSPHFRRDRPDFLLNVPTAPKR